MPLCLPRSCGCFKRGSRCWHLMCTVWKLTTAPKLSADGRGVTERKTACQKLHHNAVHSVSHQGYIYIHIYVHIGSYMYTYSRLLKAWSFGEMLKTKVMIWRGLERLWEKAMGKKILSLFPSLLLIQLISSASILYFNTLISSSVPAGSHRADEQLLICTDTFLCYYLNGIVADWLTRG